MKKAWLFFKWCLPHRMTYSEKPDVELVSIALDSIVQKTTMGKIGYGGAHMVKQKCKVCKSTFWSNRARPVCLKWSCYKEFHSG